MEVVRRSIALIVINIRITINTIIVDIEKSLLFNKKTLSAARGLH
jgi:hypothetical protein